MRTRTSFGPIKVVIAFFVIIAVALGIFIGFYGNFNDHTYVATVTDKERIVDGDESYYLIFCKDDAENFYEFKNEDTLIRGKFRSSTVYNQLEVGKKFKFTVVGFRVGIFSWYENIISFEKVE